MKNAHYHDSYSDTLAHYVSGRPCMSPTDGEIAAHKPQKPHEP